MITAGPLEWTQGFEYALLAIRQCLDLGSAVRFDIVCYGGFDKHEQQRVFYTIQDLRLDRSVYLHDCVTPEAVRNHLRQADVFMLSSVCGKGPQVLLEAMACGLAVVTTDCGGVREMISAGVEGFVVPVRNPRALAQALQALWEDAGLRKRMGEAGRRRINHLS